MMRTNLYFEQQCTIALLYIFLNYRFSTSYVTSMCCNLELLDELKNSIHR